MRILGFFPPFEGGVHHIRFVLRKYTLRFGKPIRFVLGIIKGGYDFVDVRDVAHGVLSCCENGRKGESYILSGHYATIKEILGTVKQIAGLRMCVYYVSIKTAKLFAPMAEKMALCFRKSIHLTPYAIAVLDSNGFFDREKAFKELGYTPRPLKTTLADTLTWMRIFTS